MTWLIATLVAYFLLGISMIVDKTLLSRDIKNPFVYTFSIAALGGVCIGRRSRVGKQDQTGHANSRQMG